MPRLAEVAAAAAGEALSVLGALHPGPDDLPPPGTGTIVLLGPDGPRFWERFRADPEFADGGADPMNRWSLRVIGGLAGRLGATALFPFGGPPWQPFTRWARASGEAWESPVGLLAHARLGLFVSYRGALAFREALALPPPAARPCDVAPGPASTLARPACWARTATTCLAATPFSTPKRGAAASPAAAPCAVPARSGANAAPEAQSAFHMAAFHGRQ